MKKTSIIAVGLLALTLGGCRETAEDVVNPNTILDGTMTYTMQFERIWQGVSDRYCMWDQESFDWDSIYNVYKPRFEALDAQEGSANIETLKEYYTDIFSRFHDYHMAIFISDPRGYKHFFISPSDNQLAKKGEEGLLTAEQMDELNFYSELSDIDNVEQALTKGGYLKNDSDYDVVKTDDNQLSALYANINGVAYLRTTSASVSVMLDNTDVANLYLRFIKHAKSADCKGVIIDTRFNTGGAVNEFQFLVAPFYAHDIRVGYNREKMGLGRYDYSQRKPMTITKNDDPSQYMKSYRMTVEQTVETVNNNIATLRSTTTKD